MRYEKFLELIMNKAKSVKQFLFIKSKIDYVLTIYVIIKTCYIHNSSNTRNNNIIFILIWTKSYLIEVFLKLKYVEWHEISFVLLFINKVILE